MEAIPTWVAPPLSTPKRFHEQDQSKTGLTKTKTQHNPVIITTTAALFSSGYLLPDFSFCSHRRPRIWVYLFSCDPRFSYFYVALLLPSSKSCLSKHKRRNNLVTLCEFRPALGLIISGPLSQFFCLLPSSAAIRFILSHPADCAHFLDSS